MKKKIFIFLLVFIVVLAIFFMFNGYIIKFIDKHIVYSIYEHKYDNIQRIEKTLIYYKQQNLLEENNN